MENTVNKLLKNTVNKIFFTLIEAVCGIYNISSFSHCFSRKFSNFKKVS